MRVFFKIIAVLGILSFIGGLMNNVVFIIGPIISLVFGYLGWRPRKEPKINFEQTTNQNEFLQELKKKQQLLKQTFEIGLLNQDEFDTKSNQITQAIKTEEEKITQSRAINSKLEEKYFKNKDQKRSYTKDELVNSEPLFTDDLIWKSGLKGWVNASELSELSEFTQERPPEISIKTIFRRIKKVILPVLVIYLVVSILLGIVSGLIEKSQYDTFIAEIQPKINNYYNEIERNAQLRQLNIRKNKVQQKSQYPTYEELRSRLDGEAPDKLENPLKKFKEPILLPSDSDNSIDVISYGIPKYILSVYKDGEWYSRWDVNQGVGNLEQISYNNYNIFLFRSYKALFGVAYLSTKEIDSNFELLKNFILSSLATNLIFVPVVILLILSLKKVKLKSLEN